MARFMQLRITKSIYNNGQRIVLNLILFQKIQLFRDTLGNLLIKTAAQTVVIIIIFQFRFANMDLPK